MKPSSPGPGADAFVQYLSTHRAILTDQGINVRAFIDSLSGLKKASPAPKPKDSISRSKKKPSSK